MHALSDLKANAEMADSLYSIYKDCTKYKASADSLITTQNSEINELLWQNNNMLKEIERKTIINKITIIALSVALILIPIL